jgi:hypothetical protein
VAASPISESHYFGRGLVKITVTARPKSVWIAITCSPDSMIDGGHGERRGPDRVRIPGIGGSSARFNLNTTILFGSPSRSGTFFRGNVCSAVDRSQRKESIMPVLFLWAIPAVIVLGGGGYWIIHSMQ